MSSQKTWTASKGTTVRVQSDGSPRQGAGDGKRFYVGRYGGYDYDSYVQFTQDWTDVGQVVSAILTLYVDDGFGELGDSLGSSGTPTVKLRRLTSSFSEHTGSETFDSDDYTAPSNTSADGKTFTAPRTPLEAVQVDVTAMVEDMAPKTTKRRDGTAGGAAGNYGFGLYGNSTSTAENAAFISEDAEAGVAAYKPVITLTYELGLTTPDTPTNLNPSGAVAAVASFAGDFDDAKAGDKLAYSNVQVYDAGHSATIATDDLVTSAAHGLTAGAQVYFTSLTGGVGLSTFTRYYVIASGLTASAFKVSATLNGSAVNVTDAYEAATWSKLVYDQTQVESDAAILAARFDHVPNNLSFVTGTTYRWRGRVKDNEGQWSSWTALTSFSVTNTAPTVTALAPDGSTYATLGNVTFTGTFGDVDDGDYLRAFQIQLGVAATLPEGDPLWDDASYLVWDTGKRYVGLGATGLSAQYGGPARSPNTFRWRARVWDNHDGVSAWAYGTVITTTTPASDPATAGLAIQQRPQSRWRIVIKEMKFNTVGGAITGNATTNLITSASAHGLIAGTPVRFSSLTGGTGLVVGTTYYVIASGLTSVALKVSETVDGAAVDFSSNITAGALASPAGSGRAPGNTVAILEDAMNVGASLMYNSPGEAHWTLGINHPYLPVIEPKQTHYAIEFRQGDQWVEAFAGLVWDFDATATDVVFYGIDYLALLDLVVDERYDPGNPDKDYTKGGSKYTGITIKNIVVDQLARAKALANSPVGFVVASATNVDTMSTTMTVYSTYQRVLTFVGGLLDSHRAGNSKFTRISCRRTGDGTYAWYVEDDPGVDRSNLRLRYGELVQGYRVIPFGDDWGTSVAAIGRDKDGIKVRYTKQTAPGISEGLWGRFTRPVFIDGVNDANDLTRRAKQMAVGQSMLGKKVGLGLRSAMLMPRDGYDLLDRFPVDIEHGSVSTAAFGHDGLWAAVGITFQALQQGDLNTTLTLRPIEEGSAPSGDLLVANSISSQREWQVGWTPPDDPVVTVAPIARWWYNGTTGTVYERTAGAIRFTNITGTA